MKLVVGERLLVVAIVMSRFFLGGGSVWGCLVIALGVLRLVCPCSPS